MRFVLVLKLMVELMVMKLVVVVQMSELSQRFFMREMVASFVELVRVGNNLMMMILMRVQMSMRVVVLEVVRMVDVVVILLGQVVPVRVRALGDELMVVDDVGSAPAHSAGNLTKLSRLRSSVERGRGRQVGR